MSYPGYLWWDNDENRARNDCWPFQKNNRWENKEVAKGRILAGVKRFLREVPSGWSVKWKVRRGHDLRVERSTKTIKVPFPRTRSGTAVLAVANKLAKDIVQSENAARQGGGVPAYSLSLFGFHRWRCTIVDGVARSALTFHAYDVTNDRMWRYGGGGVPYTRGVWKKAAVAGVREALRYLSSPHAWRVQRQSVKGPRLYRNLHLTSEILQVVAYRKALLDYLAVNDSHHPLPKRAKALMAKHVPVPQP